MSSILNFITTSVDYVHAGVNLIYKASVLFNNGKKIVQECIDPNAKYSSIALRIAVLALDAYSLKKNYDVSLMNRRIDCLSEFASNSKDETALKIKTAIEGYKNDITNFYKSSAAAQALALGGSFVADKCPLQEDHNLHRLSILMKEIGSAFTKKELNYASMFILGATVEGAFKDFQNWYTLNVNLAPKIEANNLNYKGIPEEHYSNPIFSQWICPITQAPIRFPVTAPNPTGGPDHHFERSAIVQWLMEKSTNPLTRHPLELKDLRENTHMRTIIENEMKALHLPL